MISSSELGPMLMQITLRNGCLQQPFSQSELMAYTTLASRRDWEDITAHVLIKHLRYRCMTVMLKAANANCTAFSVTASMNAYVQEVVYNAALMM